MKQVRLYRFLDSICTYFANNESVVFVSPDIWMLGKNNFELLAVAGSHGGNGQIDG